MVTDNAMMMQFVGLGESNLSGVLARLPQNDHDIDTEWEIDPTLLRMQEKLGRASHCWHCKAPCCSLCLQAEVLDNDNNVYAGQLTLPQGLCC